MKYTPILAALILTACNGESITPFTVVTETQADGTTITEIAPTQPEADQPAQQQPAPVETPEPPQSAPEPAPYIDQPVEQTPVQPPVIAPEIDQDTSHLPCLDVDPPNDGWGWNGVNSCQLPIEAVEQVTEPEIPAAVTQTDELFCANEDGLQSQMWFYSDATIADSNGNAATFEFDGNGHLIWIDPDAPDLIWFYDPATETYSFQHGGQVCTRGDFPVEEIEIVTEEQTGLNVNALDGLSLNCAVTFSSGETEIQLWDFSANQTITQGANVQRYVIDGERIVLNEGGGYFMAVIDGKLQTTPDQPQFLPPGSIECVL